MQLPPKKLVFRYAFQKIGGSDSSVTNVTLFFNEGFPKALVLAMETNVRMLDIRDKVTLDIAELTQYSGQGACYYVSCRDRTSEAYEQLRTWALRNNWFVFGNNTASTFIRQAVVAAAMPQQAVQEPLTATMLATAPPQEQRQMLGERLFPLIQRMYPYLAGKITGMLLEIDNAELLHMLEDGNSLKSKVIKRKDFLEISRLLYVSSSG